MKLNNADYEQLNSIINRYTTNYGKKLYHYTSMNKFFRIIKSQELWLSSTESMNDRKETVHFIEMIEKELNSYHRTDFFKKVYKQIPMNYKYAFCLSTEKDDAAQWERYADSAKGVCIVFNVEELCKCLYGYTDLMFNKVFYDEVVINNAYFKIVKTYFEMNNTGIYKNEDELIKHLIYAGNLYKHFSFKHECEVRITSMENKEESGVNFEIKEVGDVVKKILILKPEIMGKDKGTGFEKLIDKIIIGPCSQQNLRILQEYISLYGFNNLANNVQQSECPLKS